MQEIFIINDYEVAYYDRQTAEHDFVMHACPITCNVLIKTLRSAANFIRTWDYFAKRADKLPFVAKYSPGCFAVLLGYIYIYMNVSFIHKS